MPKLLIDGPDEAADVLVLAHGAGGAMDTPFLDTIARGVAAQGIRVVRFEFPYMARRREEGSRGGAPDRQPVLIDAWRRVIDDLGGGARLVIGGKSLGGRMASMVADEAGARGLVCLGYPFHPPGRPDTLRIKHLQTLRTRTLIVQGTRDPFGGADEVDGYGLSASIDIVWMPDGDHSFKPRVRSGVTEQANLQTAIERVSDFIHGLA